MTHKVGFTEVPAIGAESSSTGQHLTKHQQSPWWAFILPSAMRLARLSKVAGRATATGTCLPYGHPHTHCLAVQLLYLAWDVMLESHLEHCPSTGRNHLQHHLLQPICPARSLGACTGTLPFLHVYLFQLDFLFTLLFSTVSPLYFKIFVIE